LNNKAIVLNAIPSNFLSSIFKKEEQGVVGGGRMIGAWNVAVVEAVDDLRGEEREDPEGLAESLGGASTIG